MFTRDLCFLIISSLVVVLITCAQQEERQLVKRYQMECIEETRVDPDSITKIKAGEWRLRQEGQIQLVKDWALCVLMKAGLMTAQGVYKIDVALSKVPPEDKDVVEKKIDKCLSKKAIPAPDIAFNFLKCYQMNKDIIEMVIDNCLSQKAIPAADIAFNFVKCYQKVKTNYTMVSILM